MSGGALRRVPPAYSPLPPRAIARGLAFALGRGDDPRPRVAELLRATYNADEVILCGSGTEALQLAIAVAKRLVGERTRVAVPAFTCFEVAAAAVASGAPLALFDLDPHTLAPDLDSVERAVAEGARIVVVTPLYGLPIDWEALEGRLARHGAVAIEDAAQGHGAWWRGRRLGALGRISVLSFGRGKGWTAGRGGALLLRSGVLRAAPFPLPGAPGRAHELRGVALAAAQAALARPSLYALPASLPWLGLGETRYRDAHRPRAMARGAAAILEATWEPAEREAALRRANARALLAQLSSAGGVHTIREIDESIPGYLRLPVRLAHGLDGVAESRRARRLGLASTYPTTLARLAPVRERLRDAGARWPGAECLVRELVTLPCHSLVDAGRGGELQRLLSERVP